MNKHLEIFFLKFCALFSFCGGPLMLADSLKAHIGQGTAFLATFTPVALVLLGAFSLREHSPDRWDKLVVSLGLVGIVCLVIIDCLAVWWLITGLPRGDGWLNGLGVVIGFISAVMYGYYAARFYRRLSFAA